MKPEFYRCWCGFVAPFDQPQHDCYWVLRERWQRQVKVVLDSPKDGMIGASATGWLPATDPTTRGDAL